MGNCDWAAAPNAEDYRLFLAGLSEGFAIAQIMFDEQGDAVGYKILEVNKAYERHSGLKREQVVGKSVHEFFPAAEPEWREKCGGAVKTGEPMRFETYNESLDRWFDVQAISLQKDNKVGVLFTDISEKKKESSERTRATEERARVEAELRYREAWFAGQKETFQVAVGGAPLTTSLGVLVRTVTEHVGSGVRCAFYVADHAKGELHHVTGMPGNYGECLDGLRIGADSLPCGLAAYTGQPVITPDVMQDPRWRSWLWLAQRYEYRAVWSFPIETVSGKVVGTFAMYFKSPREAMPRDYEYAALLTRAAAIIIAQSQEMQERVRAEEALKESEQRLKDILEQLPVGASVFNCDGYYTLSNKTMRFYVPEKIPSRHRQGMKQWRALDREGNVLPPDQWPGARALRGEDVVPGMEMSYIDQFKQEHWALVSATPLRSKTGEIIGGISVIQDITERRRAEEALRESEIRRARELEEASRQKQDILESISDCFYALDKDLRFVYVNKAAEEIWGLSRADLIGRGIEDVFDGLIDISLSKFRQALDEQMPQHYEVYSKVIQRWGDMSVCPTRDGISVYFRDTTDRKRIEEALRFQANILRIMDDAVIAFDPCQHITYWSPGAQKVYGWTAEEALGKTHTEILRPIQYETETLQDKEERQAAFKRGELVQGENIQRRKDGSEFWVEYQSQAFFDGKGALAGFVTVHRDVTGRKKVEEALRKNEERQAYLLKLSDTLRPLSDAKSIQDTAACILAEHLKASQANYADYHERLGYSMIRHESLIGTDASVIGMHRIDDYSYCVNRLRSGSDLVIRDVLLLSDMPEDQRARLSGLGFRAHLSVPLIKDDKLVATLTVRQVAPRAWSPEEVELIRETAERTWAAVERAKMEEALKESEQKALALVDDLEKADKNKNEFISVLSHELRNPLAAVVAGLSILEISGSPEQAEKAMEIMKRQSNQLCKLVDDLLDLTRITQNKIKLKKETIDIREIVINAVEDIKPEFRKKGLRLWERIDAQPILLSADPVRITQCIGNMLQNAFKFTPENGTVWVSLEKKEKNAVISVQDDGIGISPETLTQLFKPFTQADHSLDRHESGGLGLGLSIVKGIVEMHDGKIAASSDGLGKGALFTISLPITQGSDHLPDMVSTDTPNRAYRILIIEDNRDLAEMLCAILRVLGHEALAAYDGIEGMKKVKETRPDIVFCDIGLPGMNGYEIAKAMREDDGLKNMRLVAMTGYAGDNDIEQAKKCGFDFHLTKPVDVAAINRLLNEIR